MVMDNVPLFPLHVVLFPGMLLPLHIFEERYRQMMTDCLAGEPRFGVVGIEQGSEVGPPANIFEVGTLAHVLRVGRYPDGRMDIITLGLRRFRVLKMNRDLPYLRGDLEFLDDEPEDPELLGPRAQSALTLLRSYRQALGLDEGDTHQLPEEPEGVSYAAGLLDLPLVQKQRMLELRSASARLDLLSVVLAQELEMLKQLGPTRTVWSSSGQPPRP